MSKLKIPNQKAKYKALNARLNRYVLLVQNLYNTYNLEAAKLAHSTGYEGDVEFSFSHYPVTKQRLNDLIASWRKDLSAIITTGTSKEWGNSNLTQDLLADKVLSYYYGKEHDRRIRKYYQTNPDSLKAFQQRKDKGMNLSQKIWKQGEDYISGLEAALSVGIQKGMSAVTLSKRVSKYLQDFDLLRKDYKQKYGKETDCLNCEYRSIRLARSEINMAYRTAEQKRWEQFDFVVGYEIKLSHVHHVKMPHGDICDTLAGKYPKDFKWTGWHPNDMCYAIPILKTEDEFFELDETSESENAVSDVPDSLKEWVIENEERIEQARIRGTLPYWLRDNDYKKYLSGKENPKHRGQSSLFAHKPTKHGQMFEPIPMKKAKLNEEQIKNRSQIAEALGLNKEQIAKLRPMSFVDADSKHVNSLTDKDIDILQNCQNCVLVFEARCRGLNVTAAGYKEGGFIERLSYHQELGYLNADGSILKDVPLIKNKNELISFIESNQLAKNGRYEIGINKWIDGTDGHIFNLIRVDGKSYYYDGQKGIRYDIQDRLDLIDFKEGVKIMRVDKLLINPEAIESFVMV